MQLHYTVSEEEFIEAGRLWAKDKDRRRRASYMTSWRGIVFLLLILSSGLLMSQANREVALWIWGALAAVWALSIAMSVLICPRLLRKNYKSQEGSMSIRLQLDEEQIESERADGASFGRFLWGAFVRFLEGPQTIVIYLSPTQFIAIPKRAMTSDQQRELLAMLNQKIVAKAV